MATGKVIRNVGGDDLTLVKISDGPKLRIGPVSAFAYYCRQYLQARRRRRFIYSFKHQRQRAQATYMPVKSSTIMHVKHTHTHTHTFNGPFSGSIRVSRYQKGETNLGFIEARDSEWQWHQLGHMQVCTSLQTDNHASTLPLSFFTGRMPAQPTASKH